MNQGFLRNIPPVVKALLIINVIIFLASAVAGSHVDLARLLGMHLPGATDFAFYQYITHMFTHVGLMHLFLNMFPLFMFGGVLERVWGGKRFLFYYLATGLGAALLQSLVSWYGYHQLQEIYQAFQATPDAGLFADFLRELHGGKLPAAATEWVNEWATRPELTAHYIEPAIQTCEEALARFLNVPMIGASGAVFGLLLAFGMLFPNTRLMLIFPPIPIKAKYFVIGYGAIELFYGIQNQAGDNVAHFAHLGGMLFGFFIVRYWQKHGKQFY
jgi:membrane associated rhomboid family serine protease